jgi:hypothetical protein
VVKIDWVRGDHTAIEFPAHADALLEGGTKFLTQAFRAFGAIGADDEVVTIGRFEDVAGGSTGRKAILDVQYARAGAPQRLFVKFSRDFDNAIRDRGRTQMDAEVRFAALSQEPRFPINVPATMFADYQRSSGTGLLISERISFGTNGIERQYHKCLDHEMPDQIGHYRALLTAAARLAGAHRGGKLPAHLVEQFPVDLQAATVGERAVFTPEQADRRLARLTEFVGTHEGLFPDSVRSSQFAARLTAEARELVTREPAIWAHMRDASDYIALCHWNANIDNAWFYRDADGALRCGLMDWGCVSRMNVAMAVWGSLSGAETELWDRHLDELLALFCDEFRRSGGPQLDVDALRRQLALYATLMGVTWLLDVPALLRKRLPDISPQTTRMDPRILDDEGVRAPLQMLANVLNLWATHDLSDALSHV